MQTSNDGGYDAFVTQLGSALSLSHYWSPDAGHEPDLHRAGNQATFTYTMTNNGPDVANNITVLDNLSQRLRVCR